MYSSIIFIDSCWDMLNGLHYLTAVVGGVRMTWHQGGSGGGRARARRKACMVKLALSEYNAWSFATLELAKDPL